MNWSARFTSLRRLARRLTFHLRSAKLPLASLSIAAALATGGFFLSDADGWHSTFFSSLTTSGTGIFVAAALAWFWFDQRERKRSTSIERTKTEGIKRLRGSAAVALPLLTGRLFKEPSNGHGDIHYVRSHYTKLRTLLRIPSGGPEDAWGPHEFEDLDRTPIQWRWILDRFVSLGETIEDTLDLYGAALVEHGPFLVAIKRLERGIRSEQERWRQFEADRKQYEQRWLAARSEDRGLDLEEEVLPVGAVFNLVTLARLSIVVVAAASLILRDWETLPESDGEHAPTFFGWS